MGTLCRLGFDQKWILTIPRTIQFRKVTGIENLGQISHNFSLRVEMGEGCAKFPSGFFRARPTTQPLIFNRGLSEVWEIKVQVVNKSTAVFVHYVAGGLIRHTIISHTWLVPEILHVRKCIMSSLMQYIGLILPQSKRHSEARGVYRKTAPHVISA